MPTVSVKGSFIYICELSLLFPYWVDFTRKKKSQALPILSTLVSFIMVLSGSNLGIDHQGLTTKSICSIHEALAEKVKLQVCDALWRLLCESIVWVPCCFVGGDGGGGW